MKKIIYAILAGIIVIGAILICTIGLNVDLIYKRNVELDVNIGKSFEINDVKQIVGEVFPGEKAILQKIDFFDESVAIILPERKNEDLTDKLEQLNTKINEKYEVENKVEEIEIYHNPKVKLSSILKPYIAPIAIATAIILAYVAIRYRKISIWKTPLTYAISIIGVEAVYLGLLAITRIPINRLTIPVGLILYVITVSVLEYRYEKKLK